MEQPEKLKEGGILSELQWNAIKFFGALYNRSAMCNKRPMTSKLLIKNKKSKSKHCVWGFGLLSSKLMVNIDLTINSRFAHHFKFDHHFEI